jgi:DNA-binding transcriptional regulator GbsR (MarR family)
VKIPQAESPTANAFRREQEATAKLIRTVGRHAATVEFESAVVGFFMESATLLGVPKSVAAIYGVCFASPAPLSFSEVKERLEMSAGSISQGLRVLREMGALTVVESTDRRECYQPDLKLRKLAAKWIDQKLQHQLDSGRTRLQGIAQAIPDESGPSGQVLRERLETLQAWHDQTRALLPIMKAFLKL